MKRAISIGVLAVFAAGCLVVIGHHFKGQLAYATIVHGDSYYYCPCTHTYKDDKAIMWNDQKTEQEDWCWIAGAPPHVYQLSGNWSGWYWLEGITYFYYNEYWKHLSLHPDDVRQEDILFCWQMSEPDCGGN